MKKVYKCFAVSNILPIFVPKSNFSNLLHLIMYLYLLR